MSARDANARNSKKAERRLRMSQPRSESLSSSKDMPSMRRRAKIKTVTTRRSRFHRSRCCNRKACKFSIRIAILPRFPIKTTKSFMLVAPLESSLKSSFPVFSETSKSSWQQKPQKTSSSNHKSCSTVARNKTLEWFSTSIRTMGSKRTRLSSGRVC